MRYKRSKRRERQLRYIDDTDLRYTVGDRERDERRSLVLLSLVKLVKLMQAFFLYLELSLNGEWFGGTAYLLYIFSHLRLISMCQEILIS